MNLNLIIRKLSRNISQTIGISFQAISKNKNKNYELSLVDRDSEIVTHNLRTSEQTQISHVSVQSKQYSVHPSRETPKGKRFLSKFDPQFYDYWEYVDAWFKVFYIQNIEMSHSWFYHFNTRMPKICLYLISFLNGGLIFAPIQKNYCILLREKKKEVRNIDCINLFLHS